MATLIEGNYKKKSSQYGWHTLGLAMGFGPFMAHLAVDTFCGSIFQKSILRLREGELPKGIQLAGGRVGI